MSQKLSTIKEIQIPKFGHEDSYWDGEKHVTTVTMESKEAVIIEIAEKLNEVIRLINSHE